MLVQASPTAKLMATVSASVTGCSGGAPSERVQEGWQGGLVERRAFDRSEGIVILAHAKRAAEPAAVEHWGA